MNEPLPIEHCAEYDAAAEWCAKRGYTGKEGDPLPPNMANDGALKWIQADLEAFQQRVRETAYALAHSKPKNPAAVALGKLNRGIPRRFSPEELAKRTQRLRDYQLVKKQEKQQQTEQEKGTL